MLPVIRNVGIYKITLVIVVILTLLSWIPESSGKKVDNGTKPKDTISVKDKINQLDGIEDKNEQVKGGNGASQTVNDTDGKKEGENKDGEKEKEEENKGTKEYRCKLMVPLPLV